MKKTTGSKKQRKATASKKINKTKRAKKFAAEKNHRRILLEKERALEKHKNDEADKKIQEIINRNIGRI